MRHTTLCRSPDYAELIPLQPHPQGVGQCAMRHSLLLLCRANQEQAMRSEEHTSELQSLTNLVCRLLLEKKKKITNIIKMSDKSSKSRLTTHVRTATTRTA